VSIELADFLIDLSDPRAIEEFRKDPEGSMERAGLREADRAALRSGKSESIRQQAMASLNERPVTSTQPALSKAGRLVVVGSGMSVGQLTCESRSWIEQADRVLYGVADPAAINLIQRLNANTESLLTFYADGKPRADTYREMVNRIMECLRAQLAVCVVFYGHPGIFVFASHEAIRMARQEGYPATMHPAVSSLDCLVADLGIQISAGFQMFGASDVVLNKRSLDVTCTVVIWQVGAVCDGSFRWTGYRAPNVPRLVEALVSVYGPSHEGILYQAAMYGICQPFVRKLRLVDISGNMVNASTTLVLPPKEFSG
jgi:Tetrapyrrole (Corrin/Porphyrin) Methylases